MAITLEVNYSKKLGLPGYSSHQYSVTIRTELSDLKQVETESSRLYTLLQGSVDRDIQQTGYLPANGNGGANGQSTGHSNGNGHPQNGSNGHHGNHRQHSNAPSRSNGQNESWSCSDKQRALITKIVDEHQLDKNDIEQLATDRFGKGVRQLNKMQASGLIEELLETHGEKPNGRNNGSRYQKARTA